MCTGYCYDLVCGHQLIHFATRCTLNCTIPSGPRKPMNDTCAPCAPSFQETNIQRKYDNLRQKRMETFRLAQAAGDRDGEAKATAQIAQDQAARTAEIAKVAALMNKLGLGGGQHVVFPGRNYGEEKKWEEDAPEDLFQGVTG
jgi:hypothetical protein